jgi:hypothetical protein
MRHYFSILVLLLMLSCQKEAKVIEPNYYLNKQEQEQFLYSIIRYVERLPKEATNENKFETRFDKDYKQMMSDCELLCYYKDQQNNIYFAVSKIAPSVKLKKTATLGKLRFGKDKNIVFYEEVCRTWKMEPKELFEKTELLFTKYIQNEDLSDYYTENSKPEFYIEFPDQNTYYDTNRRNWVTKNALY